MPRSPLLAQVIRAARLAAACNRDGLSTSDRLARETEPRPPRINRRECLIAVGRWTGAAAAVSVFPPARDALAQSRRIDVNVGIVGAGLAGLACADRLADAGVNATVYDAASRVGGRCHSLRDFFPGQVAERGGEFIDNLHKTMLGYARRFNLELEDVSKLPGEVAYYFDGQHVRESVVVDEFRDFVPVIRHDLLRLSSKVTAEHHTNSDVILDRTSLLDYLEGANGLGVAASPIAKKAIIQAYIAEYGLEPDEQSCLNLLLFIHADRRSKFTPFGVFSDERWHIVEGNDRIAQGLAAGLPSDVRLGMTLVRVARTPAGAIALTFDQDGTTIVRTHEHVVLTVPFSVLRHVELDASLGLPAAKQNAIDALGYGTNAKMMLGFTARPWTNAGSNGASYSDLLHHQATWETNPVAATGGRAILTDYSGGQRGATLNPFDVQSEAEQFLLDLERVYPGSIGAAARQGGDLVAHLEHWPSNPLTLGSYTCYRPGQFTSIAGLEGASVGPLRFAGEHTNSFYDWQGFMEGAALSGLEAAAGILRAAKKG